MKKMAIIFALIHTIYTFAQPTVEYKPHENNQAEITVLFTLDPNDCLYYDYFSVSVNSPHVVIDEWSTTPKPIDQFDSDFKESKKICIGNTTMTVHITYTQPTTAQLHINYYQKNNKKIESLSIPLTSNIAQKEIIAEQLDPEEKADDLPFSTQTQKSEQSLSWSDTISNILKTTESLTVRLIFALILGLLLSLTPCIYPMIPITVGILQSQGTKSVIKNFLLAATYTIGIATTFACLGLAAAFTGQIFGSLLAKPLFVWSLVLFLLYLAGSMIGFYDMYIPSFLQSRTQQYRGGSLLSVFLFGAVSGTIASPCLSPGLFLLLTLVTTLGSKLIGFLLLFSFGIGLGIPLLIIGTFSSSLNVLPSAGIWMVEIKKFFGFIMIGMCFFYLKNIIAWNIVLWAIAVTLFIAGLFYFDAAKKVFGWKKRYNILATFLIVASLFAAFKAFQDFYPIPTKEETVSINWLSDFDAALSQARAKNKQLFVDITAPYCSICKAIDKKLLHNDDVVKALENFVLMKIDNKESNEQHEQLQKQWSITGVPTFLIIEPMTGTIVRRFGAEIHDLSPEQFVNGYLKEDKKLL